jgi:hypothetical protein
MGRIFMRYYPIMSIRIVYSSSNGECAILGKEGYTMPFSAKGAVEARWESLPARYWRRGRELGWRHIIPKLGHFSTTWGRLSTIQMF